MKIRLATIVGIVLAGSVLSLYAAEGTAEKKAAVEKKAEAQKAAVEKKAEAAKADVEKKAEVSQGVWACPACHVMAMKAGDCPKCGKKMEAMHLLGVKDGEALLCSCGADCKCDIKGMKDGKCSCGKEVLKVSAKGMYACPMKCGPGMSDKPGKCSGCGMEMKKVE